MKEKNEIEFYTVVELCEILKLHWQTVLGFIRKGELKAFKLGRGYRVAKKDLLDFIEKKSK